MTKISGIAVLLLGAACAFRGAPVPVTGDARLLAGDWEGSYVSRETGRSGSIVFHLVAGADSAHGDVLMIPAQPVDLRLPTAPEVEQLYGRQTRVLTISFVRCTAAEVSGRLDPYEDPETGERVTTTFEGRLKGNTLTGSFVTLYQGGARAAGTWSVRRREE